jgi:hypothetical protein
MHPERVPEEYEIKKRSRWKSDAREEPADGQTVPATQSFVPQQSALTVT